MDPNDEYNDFSALDAVEHLSNALQYFFDNDNWKSNMYKMNIYLYFRSLSSNKQYGNRIWRNFSIIRCFVTKRGEFHRFSNVSHSFYVPGSKPYQLSS